MSTITNWTSGDTLVTSVSRSNGTNAVMIETNAISSGTSARNEAKTKTNTSSAP
jgi:hypothetical protein